MMSPVCFRWLGPGARARLLYLNAWLGVAACAGGTSSQALAPHAKLGSGTPEPKTHQLPAAQSEPQEQPNDAQDSSKPSPSSPPAPTPAASVLENADAEQPHLPSDTKVLHIGDSFAGALGLELHQALAPHGVDVILKYKTSTYIPTWAWNKELPRYLSRYKPDLVLITLGANELEIADPLVRVKTLERLVARLDGRPCVWIGIPLWPGAKPALMEVVREHVAPCLFLDSTALLPDLARAKDGIHPSLPARKRWAEAVVKWLIAHQEARSAAAGHWALRTGTN